ncbi:WD40 repeat-like protein [Aureobasidium sp. EXF-10728]|nr:WD40 repeat-like protein [Aureobasidium sp. EXF-10728]
MQASATLVHVLKAHTEEVARLSFSPNGRTLAATDDSTITLWDSDTGSLRSKSEAVDDMFFGMAFSPDSKWIAAASDEGQGRIWSAVTGELMQTVSVEDERMLSVVFDRDSKVLVTGSEAVRIWDVGTGEVLHELLDPDVQSPSITSMMEGTQYPPEIDTVEFSLDGKWLVSGCPNASTVCIWNTQTWKLEFTIRGYYTFFSPDGRHLAVPINEHQAVQIYDTCTWQLQSTLRDKEQELFSSVFSPDSKFVATWSDRLIKLWCVETGMVVRTIEDRRDGPIEDPQEEASALFFSPDGRILISA